MSTVFSSSAPFGFTAPASPMPKVQAADPNVSAWLTNCMLYLAQRMEVMKHLQQSPLGSCVVQMQNPTGTTTNMFVQDRIGFRQDGSNFLGGALDRVAVKYTNATTLEPTDYVALMDASTGSLKVTLPVANTVAGRIFIVKKIDTTANTVPITPQSTDTIDGSATFTLSHANQSVVIQSDGARRWNVLAYYSGTP